MWVRWARWGGVLTYDELAFFKPLWPTVVASGGSKSSIIEGLGFFEPLWPTVVASARSKSSKNEGLRFC